MSDPALKYLIPKLNNTALEVDNLENNNNLLTDNFCIVGCDTSIDYDDNDYPILGNTKPLAITYDGKNYLPISNTILYYINKIDFNGYQWIAVGSNTTYTQSMILSSDGINWITPVNNPLPYYIQDVVWGQKKWIATGSPDTNSGLNRIAYSSDGMNWTLSTYNSDNHVGLFSCVAYNGSYFLAGGFNYIAKSTDGISWTDVIVQGSLGSVNSITWNGKLWVAVGYNAQPIGYSTDGVSWNVANLVGLLNAASVVVYNGTQFLAGGLGIYKLVSSKDGINWSGVLLYDNIYLPGSISDITWNGTYWIVTNETNSVTDAKIAYSSDLVNWYSSTSGNTLFNSITPVLAITSRNRKNYISTYA